MLTGYAWGGVTGLRLFELGPVKIRPHVVGKTIPGFIECSARSGIDKADFSLWPVGLGVSSPSAKSSPVQAELICVGDGAINRDVGFCRAKQIKLSRSERPRHRLLGIFAKQLGGKLNVVGRKYHPHEHSGVFFGDREKSGRILTLYNLNDRIGPDAQRRTFPNVGEFYGDGRGGQSSFELREINFYPSPLIRPEIVAQVLPLTVGHNGVRNSSEKANYFETAPESYTPPWRGYILGVVGVVGILWGWRHDRRGWAIVVGAFLWAWALLIVLPWSGAARF